MARPKRLTKRGWRWRRNPLRRRSDIVEAWLGVVTALVLCTVPLIGLWAGQSVDRALQRVARTQRTERTLVPATVVESPASAGAAEAPGASKAAAALAAAGTDADPRRSDTLHWIAPDRSAHTAKVPMGLEVWHGDQLLLWTDKSGVLVPPPLDRATASTHAVLAGVATGSAAAGVVLMSRQLLVWRLMRRRMDSWEREWARVGQDWGRAGAGG
ncbi:Rv1733c family protein [Actinacidiphila bryophytorum]|uniref:Transmembrane protein n=3 Tax=Actinacidiphila bryophytorum TaxID=1436133 RepID=A0A9W4GZV3_9ACTN|nr:hypothetical protein [Actinacidiphila bryophytorum]MBM9439290.1 hypothetical protein [Actinacidiphila bryophytorum]CAG7619357.1 conserved hypothetical protein [Actinacidiphila bryophytorum]